MAIFYYLNSDVSDTQLQEAVEFLKGLGYAPRLEGDEGSYHGENSMVSFAPEDRHIQMCLNEPDRYRVVYQKILDEFRVIFDVSHYKTDFGHVPDELSLEGLVKG